MVQGLGYGSVPVKEVGYNSSTTVTILKGQVVDMVTGSFHTSPNTAEPVIKIARAGLNTKKAVGIATEDIEPESFGEYAVQGPVKLRVRAAIVAAGTSVGSDANGDMSEASANTFAITHTVSAASQALVDGYCNAALGSAAIATAFGGA